MSRMLVWVSVLVVGVSVLVAIPAPGDAVVPGGNGSIVFVSQRDGNAEIYKMDADGSNQVRLTNNSVWDTDPAWSPDGSKIAFRSDRDIYVMDADGSNQVRLTNSPLMDQQPAWSPDGSKIVFSSYRSGPGVFDDAIYVMNADGTDRVLLANVTAEFEDVFDVCPAWSPDGSKIAFTAALTDAPGTFYVMDADGSNLTQLSTSNSWNGWSCLEWSPDGTQLTFTGAGPGYGIGSNYNSDVYVMDADGSNRTSITNTATVSEREPTWSPDGSKIAFTLDQPGASEVYVMNVDGSDRTNLTDAAGFDQMPDWMAVPLPTDPTWDVGITSACSDVTLSYEASAGFPAEYIAALTVPGGLPFVETSLPSWPSGEFVFDGADRYGDYAISLVWAGEGDWYEVPGSLVELTATKPSDAECNPPPVDPFNDDDDSVFEADIEWMAAEGITKGCNPPVNDRFCPDSVVTRGQMAAFLTRALGLTERLDDPFIDDDDSVFEADIEKLAAAGITKGCNPPVNDRFCPDGKVTREVMAAFLVRALGYADSGGGDLFVDDDDSIFEADIDRLGTAGVTKGCNPPTNDRYCPKGNVTRGQMAAFLHRALG